MIIYFVRRTYNFFFFFFASVKQFYKTGIRGTITSPNYPENYGFMKDYYWRLATYGERIIELTLDFLDIELADDCAKDFLKVFDGPNPRASLLKTYCGVTPNEEATVKSTLNYMYLHFRADNNKDRRGFKIRWKAMVPIKTPPGVATRKTTFITTISTTETKPDGMIKYLLLFSNNDPLKNISQ